MAILKKYRKPEIDGVILPAPQANGVSISRNHIQSSKTRRTANATMTGKVVALKATVKMSFPPGLPPTTIKEIKEKVCNRTFIHKFGFTNEYSEWEEIMVYFGNYSTDQLGFINGKMLNQSLSFEAVER